MLVKMQRENGSLIYWWVFKMVQPLWKIDLHCTYVCHMAHQWHSWEFIMKNENLRPHKIYTQMSMATLSVITINLKQLNNLKCMNS